MSLIIQDGHLACSNLSIAAVFCCQVSDGGLHAGFLYERDDGTVWRCEMAWDYNCINRQSRKDGKCWVNINLDEMHLNYLVAVLEEMHQNSDSIPYNVLYDGREHFDPYTRLYIKGAPGLTCATFVDAVLRSIGFNLLDIFNWPGRDEDHSYLETLLNRLEHGRVDPERITNMRANHNNVRIRPEEVCGAVSESSWPVTQDRADHLGRIVRSYVINQCPPGH